ncbi:unnamed protein product [Adineta ricciae]|uniref:Diphthamide biosynthesis protein 3 n=1 Tax=Adineta ricciae TaxID=249248 RepID=A0A813NEL4_ADIRI|nr:unnamed protein product [Adineta ricciae]
MAFHDEVEIEDFEFDEESETYYWPCPCGDRFQITKEELESGEDAARCPSCSLVVRSIHGKDIEFEAENIASDGKNDMIDSLSSCFLSCYFFFFNRCTQNDLRTACHSLPTRVVERKEGK